MQHLQDLLMLQHGEQPVQEDLQPDGRGVGAVQHQGSDVEHDVGLHHLHLQAQVHQVVGAELVQGWGGGVGMLKLCDTLIY